MMTMDQPTKAELDREAFEEVAEGMRCFFHAEMVFEDVVDIGGMDPAADEHGALFLCPAKGCDEQKVVRL